MYELTSDNGVGQVDRIAQALAPLLGGGSVDKYVASASEYAAENILPTAMDKLVPAAIDYFDQNRTKVLNKARPALERLSQDPQARMMMARVVKRGLKRYGDEEFYPKYGKYAAPALAVGAGLLVGSLGAGYFALDKTKEKGTEAALPLIVLTWAANLAGIALTATGIGLTGMNRVLQHGQKIQ